MVRSLLQDIFTNNSAPINTANVGSSSSTTPARSATNQAPVTPIAEVVPYGCRQRIRGVCTFTEFRSTPARSVFSFTLADDKEKEISIVGFDDVAVKAHGLVYYVSGGRVKHAKKEYSITDHDFEITLRSDSEITLCTDVVITPPPLNLIICPLNRISDFNGKSVDILAIVDVMETASEVIISKTGERRAKRDLHLIDETDQLVRFTLWGDQARKFEENARGKVIGIKGAVVKLWNGVYSLSPIRGTKLKLCPILPEACNLRKWYTSTRNLTPSQSQATTIEGGILIRDLPTSEESQELRDKVLKVNASITSVHHRKYQSCPTGLCLQKVVAVDKYFYCENCDETKENCRWRTAVTIELKDCSGHVSVEGFDDIAEKIFRIYSEQREPANALSVEDEYSKKYVFSLHPTSISEDNENQVHYHVLDVNEPNLQEFIADLEKTDEQAFI